MNYYISDLHLFHEASIRFDNRPFGSLEEMHEAVVSRWNNKVNNGDTVYILGDMSMRGKKEDLISLVATLKGKKILVKGNHDDVSDYRYKQLFYDICDYKEIIFQERRYQEKPIFQGLQKLWNAVRCAGIYIECNTYAAGMQQRY